MSPHSTITLTALHWGLPDLVLLCLHVQHYKNRIVTITLGRKKKNTQQHTHTHTQPSIFTASIHRIHPLNTPYFLPSFPLFHFPTSNCSAGFSSFKFIAFHAFHLLSEWLDIYLRTVLALITCSPLPAPQLCLRTAVRAPRWDGSNSWDTTANLSINQSRYHLLALLGVCVCVCVQLHSWARLSFASIFPRYLLFFYSIRTPSGFVE